jgi:hypothetical protein
MEVLPKIIDCSLKIPLRLAGVEILLDILAVTILYTDKKHHCIGKTNLDRPAFFMDGPGTWAFN